MAIQAHMSWNVQPFQRKCTKKIRKKKWKIFTFWILFRVSQIFLRKNRAKSPDLRTKIPKKWKILTKSVKNGQKWTIFNQSGPVGWSADFLQSGVSLEFHSMKFSWSNLTMKGQIKRLKNLKDFSIFWNVSRFWGLPKEGRLSGAPFWPIWPKSTFTVDFWP